MFWKITAVFLTKNHVECILTSYEKTADFLNFKACGTDSNYCPLKYLHYGSFLSKVFSWVWLLYWPPHDNNFRYLHTLTHVVIFVSTAAEGKTHTHAGSARTLFHCLSLSASLVLTAHFYSDHSFFTMLLSGGFQSSPYAAVLQSPLLVFDVPSFHFILLLCVCVRPSYVCLFFYFCRKQSLLLCKH